MALLNPDDSLVHAKPPELVPPVAAAARDPRCDDDEDTRRRTRTDAPPAGRPPCAVNVASGCSRHLRYPIGTAQVSSLRFKPNGVSSFFHVTTPRTRRPGNFGWCWIGCLGHASYSPLVAPRIASMACKFNHCMWKTLTLMLEGVECRPE